ncbi:MAG: hypothetical protein OQK82_06075 [Candidatus Pacearchaeota archaeon]|nr:hypothetical protein [Candidatus Pacearchaeota archaeon]
MKHEVKTHKIRKQNTLDGLITKQVEKLSDFQKKRDYPLNESQMSHTMRALKYKIRDATNYIKKHFQYH